MHQLGITPRFFSEGIGDLALADIEADFSNLSKEWPPDQYGSIPIQWKKSGEGKYGGRSYSVWFGTFRTPCSPRIIEALPEESRTAHVQWIMPEDPLPGKPTVLHLAATGDHGYARRTHLAVPLISAGVGSLFLESAFYGRRKPPEQTGAKLRRVSDLLLLGRATIEESLFLLSKFHREDETYLGVCGLSMGGVHATMVASLYPGELALTPMLAPRSAAAAYCRGALYHATDWKTILCDSEHREKEITAVIKAAAQASRRLSAAKVAQTTNLMEQEESMVQNYLSNDRGTLMATAGQWENVSRWMSGYAAALDSHLHRIQALIDIGRRKRIFGGALSARKNEKSAVELLEAVLETFTDVTRFPIPRRPEAAVLVAATEDAYVSRQSVLEMHQHLPGSEIVWVPGGHVSSFLLHHNAFRSAIVRSLEKLNRELSDRIPDELRMRGLG